MSQFPEILLQEIQIRKKHLADSLQSLLQNKPRLSLEIGCGHGHYLIAYAQQYPQEFCIGIDILRNRIDRGLKKLKRTQLNNLVFLQAEAEEFLETLPITAQIDSVFILFPDPWPKKKHHRRRLIQESFLTFLARHCSPKAQLYFRTDHLPYYEWTMDIFSKHPTWKLNTEDIWRFEYTTCFQEKIDTYYSLIASRE